MNPLLRLKIDKHDSKTTRVSIGCPRAVLGVFRKGQYLVLEQAVSQLNAGNSRRQQTSLLSSICGRCLTFLSCSFTSSASTTVYRVLHISQPERLAYGGRTQFFILELNLKADGEAVNNLNVFMNGRNRDSRMSSRWHRGSFPVFGVLVALVLCGSAWSQQVTADAVGRVTDPSGAVIPNAKVSITNVGTHESRTAATNEQGDFTFSILQIGSYKARVEAPGFKSVEVPVFALQVGERHRLDVQMVIGSQSEEVVVTTEAPALQTDTASVGQTLETQAVQDLPTQGRNLYSLVQLAPGASQGPANGVSSGLRPDDRRQASEVSANGQSDSRNNNLLDGMDNNTRMGNIIVVRPSIDAVQELSVLTNSYPAEVGNVAGAVVNMLTKSGTNEFHGTAYEYFRNDLLDARDRFSTGFPKPELRQNQFGGSVGGPIRRDKTFFFADAEDLRQIKQTVTSTTVPTDQERKSFDFSDNGGDNLGANPAFQPDPAGLAFFNLYPKQNKPGIANNYLALPKGWQYAFTTDARVDHHFGPNDMMFARYSYNKADTLTPGLFPAVNGIEPGGAIFGFEGTAHETAQNAMADYTRILRSNLILELKASFTRFINAYVTLNEGTNTSEKLGVPNINVNSRTTGLTDVWPITGGYASLGDSTWEPGSIATNNFQEAALLSYSRGSHSVKAGVSLMRRQMNQDTEGPYPLGVYYFVGIPLYQYFGFGMGGNGAENLLMGLSYAGSRQNNLTTSYPRFWESGGFIQDDWRVTPKITLNLGVRYDVFTPETDAQNRLVNLDLTTPTPALVQASNSNKTAGVNTDYHDFAPRVGFSASITSKTVLHGGFALSFFPADTQNTLLQPQPPIASAYSAELLSLDAGNPNTYLPSWYPLCSAIGVPSFLCNYTTMPAPSATTSLTYFTGALYTKPKNFPSSYMEEFNVSLQQQFGQNVITVGYVGEQGRKISLAGNYNIDLPAPSTGTSPGPTPYAATLPYVTQISQILPAGYSGYNALQASFTRHFAHGWSMNANYAWAHTIDDIAGSSYVVEPYGLLPNKVSTYDRGNGDLDLRQRVAVSASYAFPITKSLTGMKKTLLNGWQLNGIGFWQSGSPYTVLNSAPQINIGSAAVVTADRPDRYANHAAAVAGVAAKGVNASKIVCLSPNNAGQCFAPQTWGTPGDSAKNILTSPSLKRVDLSIFRDFKLREWMKLQFRAESYDITNTPPLASPGSDVNTPATFGVISGTVPGSDQRVFQFALKLSY